MISASLNSPWMELVQPESYRQWKRYGLCIRFYGHGRRARTMKARTQLNPLHSKAFPFKRASSGAKTGKPAGK